MKNTTPFTNVDQLIEWMQTLSEDDLINEVLYLIYKVNDNPKYSIISELIYVLGKETLFKLCSVFGGCEIKIPTLYELRLFTGSLYVYFAMKNDGMKFEDAFSNLQLDNSYKKQIYTICMELEQLDDQQ